MMHAAGLATIRNAEIRSTYDPLVVRVFDLTTEEKFRGQRPLSLVTVDKVMRTCADRLGVGLADVDPSALPVEDAEWVRDMCVQIGFKSAGPFARRIPTLVVNSWRRAVATP